MDLESPSLRPSDPRPPCPSQVPCICLVWLESLILGLVFPVALWCGLGGFVGLLLEVDAVGAGCCEGWLLPAEPPPAAPPPRPDGDKRLVCVVEDVVLVVAVDAIGRVLGRSCP